MKAIQSLSIREYNLTIVDKLKCLFINGNTFNDMFYSLFNRVGLKYEITTSKISMDYSINMRNLFIIGLNTTVSNSLSKIWDDVKHLKMYAQVVGYDRETFTGYYRIGFVDAEAFLKAYIIKNKSSISKVVEISKKNSAYETQIFDAVTNSFNLTKALKIYDLNNFEIREELYPHTYSTTEHVSLGDNISLDLKIGKSQYTIEARITRISTGTFFNDITKEQAIEKITQENIFTIKNDVILSNEVFSFKLDPEPSYRDKLLYYFVFDEMKNNPISLSQPQEVKNKLDYYLEFEKEYFDALEQYNNNHLLKVS